MSLRPMTAAERKRFSKFLMRDAATGCLEWTGDTIRGYGRFRLRGAVELAHRVAFVDGGGILTVERTPRNAFMRQPGLLRILSSLRRQQQRKQSRSSPEGTRNKKPGGASLRRYAS